MNGKRIINGYVDSKVGMKGSTLSIIYRLSLLLMGIYGLDQQAVIHFVKIFKKKNS